MFNQTVDNGKLWGVFHNDTGFCKLAYVDKHTAINEARMLGHAYYADEMGEDDYQLE